MIAGVDRLNARGALEDPMRRQVGPQGKAAFLCVKHRLSPVKHRLSLLSLQLLGLELFNRGSSQGGRGSNPYSERYTETNPRQGARW